MVEPIYEKLEEINRRNSVNEIGIELEPPLFEIQNPLEISAHISQVTIKSISEQRISQKTVKSKSSQKQEAEELAI